MWNCWTKLHCKNIRTVARHVSLSSRSKSIVCATPSLSYHTTKCRTNAKKKKKKWRSKREIMFLIACNFLFYFKLWCRERERERNWHFIPLLLSFLFCFANCVTLSSMHLSHYKCLSIMLYLFFLFCNSRWKLWYNRFSLLKKKE